jgi:hypothetical protein
MKRSASWNKAWDELQRHQQLLDEALSEDSASSDDEISSDTKKEPIITKELRVVVERLDPAILKRMSRSETPSFSPPPCKKMKNDEFIELNIDLPLSWQVMASIIKL